MPSRVLPGLGLNGFWALGEAWKPGGDDNWLKLSVMAQLVVESMATALPANPANGVVYIAPSGAGANAWKIAVRDNGAWVYYTAPEGSVARVKDTAKHVTFLGGAWVDLMPKPAREILTAARTYYVRPGGNDSNTGLVNTDALAFATIQKAIDVATYLDNGGFTITIQVADGTYTTPLILKTYVGSAPILIKGNAANPANVLLNVTGSCITMANVLGAWEVSDMALRATTNMVTATGGTSILTLNNMVFGSTGDSFAQVHAENGARIRLPTNYRINGGGGYHWYASGGGSIEGNVITITLAGTPAFANAFFEANKHSRLRAVINTYSGAATGQRYRSKTLSIIEVGGGETYLPGNSAGSVDTGGLYL